MKAFPTTKPLDSWDDPNQGMDLRDYFAAKALPIAFKEYKKWIKEEGEDYAPFSNSNIGLANCEMVAEMSYRLADAMIKARKGNDD